MCIIKEVIKGSDREGICKKEEFLKCLGKEKVHRLAEETRKSFQAENGLCKGSVIQ